MEPKAPLSDEQDALKLANKIRDLLGSHLKSDIKEYPNLITSSVMALAMEVGRLRWLSVSTGDTDADNFDKVFWQAAFKQYEENESRYGTETLN